MSAVPEKIHEDENELVTYDIDPKLRTEHDFRCLLWMCLESEVLPVLWHNPKERTCAISDVDHADNFVKKLTPILSMFDKIRCSVEMPPVSGLGLYIDIWFPNKNPSNLLRVDLCRTQATRNAIEITKSPEGNDLFFPNKDPDAEYSMITNSKPTHFSGLKAFNVIVNFVADFPVAVLTLPDHTDTFMVSIDYGLSRAPNNPFREEMANLCLKNYVIAKRSTTGQARLKIHHPTK